MLKYWGAICLIVGFSCSAHAQQPAAPSPVAPGTPAATSTGYDRCILAAVANADVYKDEAGIQFRCFGPAAEYWFNQLPGGKDVKDPNGVFNAKYFEGSGYCAHHVKSAAGADVSNYLCVIDRPPLK